MRTVLITGGHGFIGSNLVQHWLARHPDDFVVNVDAMTYAARPDHVNDFIRRKPSFNKKYFFEMCDIRSRKAVEYMVQHHKPDIVIHLAAESHVCRSIRGPEDFVHTNVVGTFNLLEECRRFWGDSKATRFHHVSTDEVFGELMKDDEPFDESFPLLPRSPYAASKAASDLLVKCYHETYKMNATISNCSNNFGPNQHFEKLIPKAIHTIHNDQQMTVYGPGTQIRDWLYVDDHCEAIDVIVHKGQAGERYCVGGDMEMSNIEAMECVEDTMKHYDPMYSLQYLHTDDRPTDDFRYAINCSKLKSLGWAPSRSFKENLTLTVKWYLDNLKKGVKPGASATQEGGCI